MAHANQGATGMEAYFRPSRSRTLTCACQVDSPGPGWIDAGCVYHGIESGIGHWKYWDEAEKMRRAVMPSKRPNANNRWG